MSKTIVSTLPKISRGILTYQDYLTFPDGDGIKKEIVEGELFMSPAPALKHQIILKKLFSILNDFARTNHLGEVFYAPCDVVFSNIRRSILCSL